MKFDTDTRLFADDSGNEFRAHELVGTRKSNAFQKWLDENYPKQPLTVRDTLGDPSTWENIPEGFSAPDQSYLSARLGSVVDDGNKVVIIINVDGQMFKNEIPVRCDSDAAHIIARIQGSRQQAHELLVEVMNTVLEP